jgi:hypothetical protein
VKEFSDFITQHPVFVLGCFTIVVLLIDLASDVSKQWAKRP